MKSSSTPINSDPDKTEAYANNNFIGVAVGNGYLAGKNQFAKVHCECLQQFSDQDIINSLIHYQYYHGMIGQRYEMILNVFKNTKLRQWDILLSPDCCKTHQNITENTYWCDWYSTAIDDVGPCCKYAPKDPKRVCDRVVN